MMKKAAIMGFGKQGIRAVSGVTEKNMPFFQFYVDREKDFAGQCPVGSWKVDLALENSAKADDGLYFLKDWLRDNKEKVLRFFDNFPMVILCAGLGGGMAEDAIDTAYFLKENRPDLAAYIVCSQPFRRETDYQHNALCRKEIQLMKDYGLTWIMIDNEKVYLENEKRFSRAYEISCCYLTNMIECILNMPGSGMWNSGMEISEMWEYFPKCMTYIADQEHKRTHSVVKKDLCNKFLPYDIEKKAGKILISIQTSEEISIVDLADIIDETVNCFEGRCEYLFRVFPGYPIPGYYRMTVIAPGKETAHRHISYNDIALWDIGVSGKGEKSDG